MAFAVDVNNDDGTEARALDCFDDGESLISVFISISGSVAVDTSVTFLVDRVVMALFTVAESNPSTRILALSVPSPEPLSELNNGTDRDGLSLDNPIVCETHRPDETHRDPLMDVWNKKAVPL